MKRSSRFSLGLTPERRELLEHLLRETGLEAETNNNIPRRQNNGPAPASFAQQRLWFLDQLVPNSPFYNLSTAVRFRAVLSIPVLERSINAIVQRHEALRTTFAAEDGRPVQVIAPQLAIPLTVIDLRGLPRSQAEAEATRLATEEAARPFDLMHGPLLRTTLLQLDDAEYVFLLTVHHIISDAWSLEIFARELTALYSAFAIGQPSPLPPLPIQYPDFAVWQRQWLQGEVLADQVAYWKRQLADLPILQLPTDRPRPVNQRYRGALLRVELPKSLSAALAELSQHQRVTLFMTLLAAFQVLLHRSTGQDDIVVGVPIAGRNRSEAENLIGFFVNSLVLRTDLSGNPSFRELLGRVREATLGAYAYQDLPFEILVDEMQPERDLGRNPLFQVTFQLQQPAYGPRLEVSHSQPTLDIKREAAIFDLAFRLWETTAGISGGIEYNTDLFDADTIARMAGHYRTLLESIVVDPDRPVAELPLLTPDESQRILVMWNDTAVGFPRDVCLHHLFEDQVRRTPDAIAVVFEDQSVTYRELDQRANQLARHLQTLGVGPEVLVGICMERSLEMVVALFGVLKAGAAYVPLDPSYPQERIAFMVQDSGARVIVTQRRLVSRLPAHGPVLVVLDDMNDLNGVTIDKPTSAVTLGHPAYVIYTSGSTGRPKGVVISHSAICNHMFWMQCTFPLAETDRVLQKSPFSFDASVWEFYAPLMAGARLVMAQPGGHADSVYLVRTIAEQEITILQVVPTLLWLLLAEPGIRDCRSLRRVFCGGEPLPVDLQERFFASLNAELCNLYGPTEASIDTTFWLCQPQMGQHTIPIGRPIANVQACVLDRHLHPVPAGIPGELCIGGEGLASSYHRRPALTAEKFIPDPFSARPGVRLYRTGDRVRFRPDGAIEFLGRLDQQVKLRGFRIELEEIEVLLREHPAVRECAVLVREDAPGDQRLVAYLVVHRRPEVAVLRRHLQQRLPEHMIPASFVFLDRLPLTPNGKLDCRALPAPDATRPARPETYVAPCTPTEETLARIWAEVVGLDQVSIHDNFFEIGGHSLLATHLVSRVCSVFQIEVPLRQIFESPSVAEFAPFVTQLQAHKVTAPIESIPRADDWPLLGQLDQLSEEDVDRWLRSMLPEKEDSE